MNTVIVWVVIGGVVAAIVLNAIVAHRNFKKWQKMDEERANAQRYNENLQTEIYALKRELEGRPK